MRTMITVYADDQHAGMTVRELEGFVNRIYAEREAGQIGGIKARITFTGRLRSLSAQVKTPDDETTAGPGAGRPESAATTVWPRPASEPF